MPTAFLMFYLRVLLGKALYCKEDCKHENEAYAESDVHILTETCNQVAYKADARNCKCVGKLSGNMVNVVTLCTCGGHDSRVGDR